MLQADFVLQRESVLLRLSCGCMDDTASILIQLFALTGDTLILRDMFFGLIVSCFILLVTILCVKFYSPLPVFVCFSSFSLLTRLFFSFTLLVCLLSVPHVSSVFLLRSLWLSDCFPFVCQ